VNIGIVTLFTEMFEALNYGIPGRAIKQGLLSLQFWDPRDYANDRHRTVDDRPYGGGPGMVMQVAPLQAAIDAAKKELGPATRVIYLSPQGRPLDQAAVKMLAERSSMILVAGRYEGIDERLIETTVDEEWSVGDYVLSGGELPAMLLLDAVVRYLPGALGHSESAEQDSFSKGLLDHPHYTRPEDIAGHAVPPVLMSGDHQAIAIWRLKQALGRTWLRRPELLEKINLSKEQEDLLIEFIEETKAREQNHE
jgi:tRNA (guanine37-N1)-methyltransferase